MTVRALVAEFLGTFTLVAFGSLGISSAILATSGQDPTVILLLIVPFAFGLGLAAAIAIGGYSSGGHYNPAVTLGAWFDGRLDWKLGLGYVVAQIFGALAASLGLLAILSMDFVAATVTRPGPTSADPFQAQLHAFSVELVLTMVFVAVILTITRRSPRLAILVIPLTLVAIHFAAILISGASVNPARSLAPAAVSGDYKDLWIYLTAPFLGAILGWGVYRILNPPDEDLEVEAQSEFEDDDLGEVVEEDEATA